MVLSMLAMALALGIYLIVRSRRREAEEDAERQRERLCRDAIAAKSEEEEASFTYIRKKLLPIFPFTETYLKWGLHRRPYYLSEKYYFDHEIEAQNAIKSLQFIKAFNSGTQGFEYRPLKKCSCGKSHIDEDGELYDGDDCVNNPFQHYNRDLNRAWKLTQLPWGENSCKDRVSYLVMMLHHERYLEASRKEALEEVRKEAELKDAIQRKNHHLIYRKH